MTQKPFFITTPIYYSNDIPHVGHAYSTFIADVIARDRRRRWYDVKFSTGVDENSQKVVDKAAERGIPLESYVDEMAAKHRSVWDALDISYTDFVRTHHPSQTKTVQYMLQKSYDAGDIYLGKYEGAYCIWCEAFKKPSDLTPEGHCPIHKKPAEMLSEENYFFRLKKYEDTLKELYMANPDLIQPSFRGNEVREFIAGGLEDFSISRAGATFGIPLPFDPTHITYVWYDALFNYVSILVQNGDLGEGGKISSHWPADVHVMGKDIVRFHGIYWPAMLCSVGLEIPKKLLTTGYLTLNGEKMSKSLGNVVNPIEYINTYSRDLLVSYLMLTIPLGGDGDFSEEESVTLYNAHLANNLGNLINRVVKLWMKRHAETVVDIALSQETVDTIISIRSHAEACSQGYELKSLLETLLEAARALNKYLDTHAPWKQDLSTSEGARIYDETLSHALRVVRVIAEELSPFFPVKMEIVLSAIVADVSDERVWVMWDIGVIFPRFECQNITKKEKNA